MRIALGCVVALAGCNQLFGNDPVMRWDAAESEGPPEAALPTARLELLLASTDASGAATNVAVMRPIEPAPLVQVGRIDGPVTPTVYRNGAVDIPIDYPGTPWRLVYTPPGDVPHEVHWAPAAGTEGRMGVPQFGGVDRAPVPAGASYRLEPTSATPYTNLRVYTTGTWAVGTPTAAGAVATMPFTAPAMQVISGPLLAPDNAKGDIVLLANYAGTFPCQWVSGAAVFRIALTGPDSTESPAPTYASSANKSVTVRGDTIGLRARLGDRLGQPPQSLFAQTLYGLAASSVSPAFVTHPFSVALWGPAAIPLIRCTNADITATDFFVEPVVDAAVFPHVAHVQLWTEHILPGGAHVFSGIASTSTTATAQTTFDLAFEVGIPIDVRFGNVNLTGPTDRTILTGAAPTIDLTFALDEDTPGVPYTADYATATLYRASSATLVRERVFTFTGTKLTIDRAVLASQAEYVFELRTFKGAPDAAAGDFTRFVPAQASAVRFTRTFLTP